MKFLPNLSTPLYVALETDEVELGQAKEKAFYDTKAHVHGIFPLYMVHVQYLTKKIGIITLVKTRLRLLRW